jgi:triacylglycerol lipase
VLLAAVLLAAACSRSTGGSAEPSRAATLAQATDQVTSDPDVPDSPSPTSNPGPGLGPVGLIGVNDPACTSIHRPVLLLHGTFSSIVVDFPVLVPALTAAGFCVYGADYGLLGTQAVRASAASFASVVDQVRSTTGASQVDAVGFSQGGLVLRTALRFDSLVSVVHTAVMISPSINGTTSPLISALPGGICAACTDQAAGSALLTDLAAGGDLDGAVRYAVAVTSSDQIVTPWQRQIPDGPADRVRSVVLDQQCGRTTIRHQDMPRDQGVVGWVVAALAADGDVQAADLICTPGTG